jgi:hypothetical protein
MGQTSSYRPGSASLGLLLLVKREDPKCWWGCWQSKAAIVTGLPDWDHPLMTSCVEGHATGVGRSAVPNGRLSPNKAGRVRHASLEGWIKAKGRCQWRVLCNLDSLRGLLLVLLSQIVWLQRGTDQAVPRQPRVRGATIGEDRLSGFARLSPCSS